MIDQEKGPDTSWEKVGCCKECHLDRKTGRMPWPSPHTSQTMKRHFPKENFVPSVSWVLSERDSVDYLYSQWHWISLKRSRYKRCQDTRVQVWQHKNKKTLDPFKHWPEIRMWKTPSSPLQWWRICWRYIFMQWYLQQNNPKKYHSWSINMFKLCLYLWLGQVQDVKKKKTEIWK